MEATVRNLFSDQQEDLSSKIENDVVCWLEISSDKFQVCVGGELAYLRGLAVGTVHPFASPY